VNSDGRSVQLFGEGVRQENVGISAASAHDRAFAPSIEFLYQKHWAELVRVGTLLVGSPAVAEDIVQDAFVRLHRSKAMPENPRAYLRRSVVNGVIDYRRHQAIESRFLWAQEVIDDLPEIPVLLPHLQRLPERQRDALVLRYYLDLPLKEVAQLIGCSLGTTKSHVHRGLAALKKEIER
jgi:RNA polymerase sigma factor (sigma-70 family)